MAQARREQEIEQLQRQLDEREFIWLLQGLRQSSPIFTRFETWRDVIAFMREGGSRDPRKDDVLRAIFEAHGTDQDPRWRTVLLVIFWPALCSIHRQKARWDKDPEELWQNITWTFLRVVCHIDVSKRPCGLVQKLFNDTVHRLYGEYRRKWSLAAGELALEADDLDALSGGIDDIDYAGIELRIAQAAEIRRLRAHLDAGRISEPDFLLLVGTRVYGKSAAEYARETGMDCALARQRRFRAESAIRRHERAG